jgi:hypothetical protein
MRTNDIDQEPNRALLILPAMPAEPASAYVLLVSDEASCMRGDGLKCGRSGRAATTGRFTDVAARRRDPVKPAQRPRV